MEAYYGFMEDPDVPALLEAPGKDALQLRHDGHVVLRLARDADRDLGPGMALWREKLFVVDGQEAVKATDFFRIPTNRVVELGTQVEL